MGAWGHRTFDNDTACDWVYGLEKATDLSLVEAALRELEHVGDDYLDPDVACTALAACEVLAAASNRLTSSDRIPLRRDTGGWAAESMHAWCWDAKVAPDVRDELCIGRVVGRLDAGDLAAQTMGVLLHVVEELALRGRRAENEDFFRRAERLHHVGKEAALVLRTGVRLGRPLRVAADVVGGCPKRLLVEPLEIDVEDAGLLMIQPHCGTGGSSHGDAA